MIAGTAVSAISVYGYQVIAGRTLGTEAFAPIGVLWTVSFLVFTVLFLPVEQYITRRFTLGSHGDHALRRDTILVAATIIGGVGIGATFAFFTVDTFFLGSSVYVLVMVGILTTRALLAVARGFLAGARRFRAYGMAVALEGLVVVVSAALVSVVAPTTLAFAVILGLGPLAALLVRPFKRSAMIEAPSGGLNQGAGFLGALIMGTAASQMILAAGPIVVGFVGGTAAAISVFFITFTLFRGPVTSSYNIVARVLPDFTLAWIRSFWMLYRFSGSADLAREYGDEIMRAFSYFFEQSESTGLLPTDPRYWLFLDWAETFKDGTSTLYNLEYLETLENARELFEAAELVDFAQEVQMRADALRQTILEKLWNTQAGEPFDGLDRKGEPVPRSTLHTLVRSILLNIHPEEHRRWADEYLLPFIAGERPVGAELYADVKRDVDLGVLTPYFLHFTFLALEKLGEDEAILSCIQRWWGNMIDRGLSTTEEVWDAVPGIASTCHAWAAHPLQHITRSLLGIRPTAPGWKEILFKPGSIATAVRGPVDTPLGPIRVELDESGEHGRLELPAGIHAKIEGVSRTGKPYHFIPLGPSGSLEYAVH